MPSDTLLSMSQTHTHTHTHVSSSTHVMYLSVERRERGHDIWVDGERASAKVRVVERLPGGDPCLWVVGEQGIHEVAALRGELRELTLDVVVQVLVGGEKELGDVGEVVEPGPYPFIRRPQQLEHLLELLDVGFTAEQRLLFKQLTEDAPDRPHVQRGVVLARPKE